MCAIEYGRLIRERNDPRWQQTTEVHTSSLICQARPKVHYTAHQTMAQLVFLFHGIATSSRIYGFHYQGGASLRRWQKKRPSWFNACSLLKTVYTRAGGELTDPQEGGRLRISNTTIFSGDRPCLGVRQC